MNRKLNVRQKNLLKRWYMESGQRMIYEGDFHYQFTVDDLTDKQWDILEKIKDNVRDLRYEVIKFLDELKLKD